MPTPKTERIVEVAWEDSACTHGWNDAPGKVANVISVGHVQEDDEYGISLVESVVVSDKPGVSAYGCSMAIPRSAIRKVTNLTRGRKR